MRRGAALAFPRCLLLGTDITRTTSELHRDLKDKKNVGGGRVRPERPALCLLKKRALDVSLRFEKI